MFFEFLIKYKAFAILVVRCDIWYLKLSSGSMKIPRNLMAGVAERELTCSMGIDQNCCYLEKYLDPVV